jgi:uncharacterized damage-inducible protein DinB
MQRLIRAPGGYEPSIARWVWALQDTRRRTNRVLDDVTQEILDWVPPEGGDSIGTLLYHIVAIQMSYLYEDILEIGWSEELEPLLRYDVRDAQGRLTAVEGESLETHLKRLETGQHYLLNALRAMTAEEFRRPRQLESYRVTPEWVLHHLMQHEAEHRGQIAALRSRAEQRQ